MKRFWILSSLAIFSFILMGDIHAEETASPKEVAKKMAGVWCEKLAECDQSSGMSPKECRKVLKDSFHRGFQNPEGGSKVTVSKEKLTKCSESIQKDTCDALKKVQSLAGCDFISMLNRY